MKLIWSAKFTRAARKLARRKPELLGDLDSALRQLEADPFHPSLRTHKLSGDFDGCWACSAGYDFRVVFEFVRPTKGAEMEVHLLNVGTHDEVY
jgi:addiction module RelE/StbE family toxin